MCGIGNLIFLIGSFGFPASHATSTLLTLHNKHFKMGAVLNPLTLSMKKNKNGQESYSGLMGDFLENIKKARNCTFTIVEPPEGQWESGNCYGNNNCTGLLGLVTRNEVDFALGFIHTFNVQIFNMLSHTIKLQDLWLYIQIGQRLWISPFPF